MRAYHIWSQNLSLFGVRRHPMERKKKTENGTRDEVQVCFGLTVVGTL